MIIIGITGPTGAGKSTFSEMILKNNSKVKIIHLDHVYDKIKSYLPFKNVSSYKRDDGEIINYLNRDGLAYRLFHIKGIEIIYQKIKKLYAKSFINQEIEFAYQNGVEYLVLEGVNINDLVDFQLLDLSIFISAPQNIRRERVNKRDKKIKELINDYFINDVEMSECIKSYYDYYILNVDSIEELSNKASDISNYIMNNYNDIMKRKLTKH